MKTRFMVIAIVSILLLIELSGCNGEISLNGKWGGFIIIGENQFGQKQYLTAFTFTKENKVFLTVEEYTMTYSYSGTYETEDNILRITTNALGNFTFNYRLLKEDGIDHLYLNETAFIRARS